MRAAQFTLKERRHTRRFHPCTQFVTLRRAVNARN